MANPSEKHDLGRTHQPAYPDSEAWQSNTFAFRQCLDFISYAGRSIYGERFRIHEEDREVIFKLLVYFLEDGENAIKLEIDLRKGVLLTGPVGCGKTTLMAVLSQLLAATKKFVMKSTREVTFEFIRDGFGVINKYSRSSHYLQNSAYIPRTYCFDDLGVESNIKYYGNETNVMAEVLLSRYDMFVSQRMLTHATTNLNAKELEGIYGNRVRSRMREMFNLIGFEKATKDKRV